MITNFEEVTCDLTKEEYKLVPVLIAGLNARTKLNPILSEDIVMAINARRHEYGLKNKFNGARLRKLCNFIRSTGMIPLIASKNGYYVSKNQDEINDQIKSLEERAASIMASANGLRKFI